MGSRGFCWVSGLIAVLAVMAGAAGCTNPTSTASTNTVVIAGSGPGVQGSDRSGQDKSVRGAPIRVAASFYPLVFLAQQIGGELVSVDNITPPGVEPHDVELSPDQAARIEDAQLVITLGRGFQPSVEKAAARRPGGVLSILDRLQIDGVPVVDASGAGDPHVWLDPTNMQKIARDVAEALAQADPVHADAYREKATTLSKELETLDAELHRGLSNCKRTTVVTSHASFGHFARRYGLTARAVAGFAPDVEPTANQLADLADLVKRSGATTIFTEEAVSADIAKTLARETGVSTAVLSPLELKPAKGDYLSAMRTNLSVLQKGLECAG